MRKILAITLAAVMMLSLCSCALFDNLTAYGLYLKAINDLEKAGGFEADCDMVISMGLLGESIDIPMSMNIKQNGDNVQAVADYGELLGYTMTTTTIDGYSYIDMEGYKVKYALPESEQTEEQLGQIPEIAEDAFEGIEIIKNEDGTKQISILIDEDAINSLLGTALGEAEAESASIDEVLYVMTFDEDNNLQTVSFSCDMEVESSGIVVDAALSAEYTYVNFGKAPEIVLPSDASEYTEIEYTEE